MIYLPSFHILSKKEEEDVFNPHSSTYIGKSQCTYFSSYYPFGLFQNRNLTDLYFSDITVLYGNNGSGKSTVLNVIAEKLRLHRDTPFNRSDFFDDYVKLCRFDSVGSVPGASRIITSDDVFEKVLDIRRINEGIDNKKANAIEEFISERNDPNPNRLKGLDDYDRWKSAYDIRKKSTTQSQYIRTHVMRNLQERSNGESALAFFVDSITDNALYLLDEPENSLSPKNQILLKYFIEDCVRTHNCQFIISTHSPFILSLYGARIYDIDSSPVRVCRWTELEGVRAYYDFFSEHASEFEV